MGNSFAYRGNPSESLEEAYHALKRRYDAVCALCWKLASTVLVLVGICAVFVGGELALIKDFVNNHRAASGNRISRTVQTQPIVVRALIISCDDRRIQSPLICSFENKY